MGRGLGGKRPSPHGPKRRSNKSSQILNFIEIAFSPHRD